MKITPKMLSIPPYLSTTWKNISSLHVKEKEGVSLLIVLLQNRIQVEIPNLDQTSINEIFEAHAKFVEMETPSPQSPLEGIQSFTLPLKTEGSFALLNSSMQHNPAQADLPPLPPEILKKISIIARLFGLDETDLAKAEKECNCLYCQIVRFFGEEEEETLEEEVSDEELTFRSWDIVQTAEKLYLVTNPLDQNEQYNVFLGEPLGCTCGEKQCEHIRAVLST